MPPAGVAAVVAVAAGSTVIAPSGDAVCSGVVAVSLLSLQAVVDNAPAINARNNKWEIFMCIEVILLSEKMEFSR